MAFSARVCVCERERDGVRKREREEQKWAIIASASAELLSTSEVDRAAEKSHRHHTDTTAA